MCPYGHLKLGMMRMSLPLWKEFATKIIGAFALTGNDGFEKIPHIVCDQREDGLFLESRAVNVHGCCSPRRLLSCSFSAQEEPLSRRRPSSPSLARSALPWRTRRLSLA